jgi:hypothetical protein
MIKINWGMKYIFIQSNYHSLQVKMNLEETFHEGSIDR